MKISILILNYPLLVLSLLWGLVFMLVSPYGEFPLNDDWAYAKSVQWLVEDGALKTMDWPAMHLIGQTLVGAIWCKIVGYGFFQLRLLTFILSLVTLIFSFKLFHKLCNQNNMAFFGTLVILSNPIFMNVSFSFMTDAYFLLPVVLAFYAFVKMIQGEK